MYQSLQGCRAVAAALVVLFHLGGTFAQDKYFGYKALDGPFAWGDAGVDFFFVLSGFLITIVHRRDFGRPQALAGYLTKRSLRIYPTYWLICLAVCVAALAFPSLRQALPSDPLVFVGALTLLPLDPAVVGGTGSPILFVAWSLQYEMLFYAIVAVFILNRTAGILVVVGMLLFHVDCRLGHQCEFPQSFVASNMVFLFGMGVATAYWARSRLALPYPRLVATGAAVAFVAFGAIEAWIGRDAMGVDRRLVYGALGSLVIIGLVRAEDAGSLWSNHRWIGLLGDSSYALYLVHIPIISILCKLLLRAGPSGGPALVAAFAAVFLACVATAVLFHIHIERPLLAALRARLRPGSNRSGPTVYDPAAAPRNAGTHESLG